MKTSCKQYEESLWEAAETGELSTELTEHLAACPECRKSWLALQAGMIGFQALRRLPEHVPAVHISPVSAFPWRRAAAFATVIVLVLLAIRGFLGPRPSSHTTPVITGVPSHTRERAPLVGPVKPRKVTALPDVPIRRRTAKRASHHRQHRIHRILRSGNPRPEAAPAVVATASPIPVTDNLKPLSALPVYNLAVLTEAPHENGEML